VLIPQNQINASILFVILLFPISTAFTVWTLSTLPISIPWPRNISDLAQLGRELQGYSRSGTGPLIHVALVMSLSADMETRLVDSRQRILGMWRNNRAFFSSRVTFFDY
jgi:hypothetical protein